MPQYRLTQYGLGQYGYHQTGPGGESGQHTKWRFIRSRFGIRRDGKTFWLYQHQPVTFMGEARKLRLKTNLGETIQQEQFTIQGGYPKIRLTSNLSTEPIVGQRIERR